MILEDALRRQLNLLVFKFLGPNPAVVALEQLVGAEAVTRIPILDTPFKTSVWVVDQTLALPTPDLFCLLVRTVDPAGTRPPLLRLVESIESRTLPWETARTSVLEVENNKPFVDRNETRAKIERLIAPFMAPFEPLAVPAPAGVGAGRCLSVQAGKGEGKSWVLAWCIRRLEGDPKVRMAHYKVEGSLAASLTPRIVATELALGLGVGSKRPRPHEDPDRDARNLATWISNGVRDAGVPSLVVLDQLNHAALSEPVHTFARGLLEAQAKDPEVARLLSIVLLGYDEEALRKAALPFESCVLELVEREEVKAWFQARYPGRADYEYDDAADQVMEGLPPGGPARLATMCTEIGLVAKELQ